MKEWKSNFFFQIMICNADTKKEEYLNIFIYRITLHFRVASSFQSIPAEFNTTHAKLH